jgi:hypothetical protein
VAQGVGPEFKPQYCKKKKKKKKKTLSGATDPGSCSVSFVVGMKPEFQPKAQTPDIPYARFGHTSLNANKEV